MDEVKETILTPSGLLCDPCFYGETSVRVSAVVLLENDKTNRLLCGNHAEVLVGQPLETIDPKGR